METKKRSFLLGQPAPFLLLKEKGRKGQFFVMSAIVLVISLFTLTEALVRPFDFDPSIVQGQNNAMAYLQVADVLNGTVKLSAAQEKDNNVLHLLVFLREELAAREYTVEIQKANAAGTEYDIVLKSPDIFLKKRERVS